MRRSEVSMVCALVLLGATSVARAQTTCTGDCNGDGEVTINELILGVNIALGSQPLSACPAFDCEGNGMVPINCLIQGVNNALNGCNPSPTPTPTTGGTELVYTIDPGTAGVGPDQSGTGIFVGIIGDTNAAVAFSPGPLTLVMGTPDSNGIASLTLKEDTTISVDIIDGSCLCLKLEAANEFGGTINCNGGSMYDTMATRAANAPDLTWMVTTGLGSPSGAGDANLLLTGLFDHVSSSCVAADCPTHTYINPPNEFAFTTTNATAVQEVSSGPPITLTNSGTAFNCATFGTPGLVGQLAAPVPTVMDPVGPVAAVIRLSQMAPH